MPRLPQAARKHHGLSALLSQRAVREARRVRGRGLPRVASVIAAHQITSARESQSAVGEILAEQGIRAIPEASLALVGYATEPGRIAAMLDTTTTRFAFDRLVASLVQDAGNAAEQVAIAARPNVGWVRHLTPPSCSRCVPLAGRVYRYSDGFLRHPGDDCVTIAVAEGDASLAADPVEMVRGGQVSGLSKADHVAILDGADFNQVVNVRRASAGLTEAGHTLARAGRPTPAGIYRIASDRRESLELLARFGYVL